MTAAWLARAADDFWNRAGPAGDFELALQLALPAQVEALPALTLAAARRHLRAIGLPLDLPGADRPLRGCLVAHRGRAVVFLDAADPPDERRFTAAHEAAHLVLDYLQPRERAARALGPDVLAVLDGDRAPTPAERLDAALARVPLGPHRHLLERDGPATVAAEDRADRLALELLAPADLVLARLGGNPTPERARALLVQDFRLPPTVALIYAAQLAPARGRLVELFAAARNSP